MPRSRHASSFPHGCQLSDRPVSGRTINQDPGLDLATQSQPEDGTKGVVMKAAATAEPERSCIVTFHPFLSLLSVSKLEISLVEPVQYALNGSTWETLSFHNYQKFDQQQMFSYRCIYPKISDPTDRNNKENILPIFYFKY